MTKLLWISLLALLGTADSDPAPFGFRGIELYKVSPQAQNLVTADFNGDGLLDFALASNERSRLEIFLQKKKPGPDPKKAGATPSKTTGGYDDVNEIHDDARFRKVLIPLESTVYAMVAADVDGDHAPELVLRATPSRLSIWKHEGNDRWSLARKIKIKEGTGPAESLLAADVNGDKRMDVVLLEKEAVSLFLQDGSGRLKPAEHYPTSLRDATGLHFLRPTEGPPLLVLYRHGQEFGLALRPVLEGALGPEWRFRSGKFNTPYFPPGEPRPALVAVMRVSDRLHKKVVCARENPDLVFETPFSLYPVAAERGVKERGVTAGDLDGDGRADVLVSRPSASTLEVYLQARDGTFRAPRVSSTFAGTTTAEIADHDGGGGAEVLVVSPEEQVVGLAEWKDGRLAFPHPLPGIEGKPHAATSAVLIGTIRRDLAVVTEQKRKYTLIVLREFGGEPIRVPLDFLDERPTRLLAVDIDADGDQDLAVITNRNAFGLVLNKGGGKFTALGSEKFGGKWLLNDVEAGSYSRTTLPSGREAILVAKKTLGRAVGLDAERKLVILEQINAGEDTKLTGIARAGDTVTVVDEKSSSLLVLRQTDGVWKRVQEIELPSNIIRSIEAVQLNKDGEPDLLLAEKSGFLVVRRGSRETRLESAWSYESDVKDAKLRLVTGGDLNGDGQPDLAVTDAAKRALELLVPPDRPDGSVHRGLRFEIFEENREYRRRSSHVREMVVADLTGDGKDDLLFLLHDRVVLYPQE